METGMEMDESLLANIFADEVDIGKFRSRYEHLYQSVVDAIRNDSWLRYFQSLVMLRAFKDGKYHLISVKEGDLSVPADSEDVPIKIRNLYGDMYKNLGLYAMERNVENYPFGGTQGFRADLYRTFTDIFED
ncbi:MAG: hypothetical protein JSV63_00080 [Candidatus Aenigmatarchaeota archaeon]|nr:MAG: hypothetical protein JSV63_00080 [Candidatus Aenigmarchaeota archaeon]